jgi:hypothetical protein
LKVWLEEGNPMNSGVRQRGIFICISVMEWVDFRGLVGLLSVLLIRTRVLLGLISLPLGAEYLIATRCRKDLWRIQKVGMEFGTGFWL